MFLLYFLHKCIQKIGILDDFFIYSIINFLNLNIQIGNSFLTFKSLSFFEFYNNFVFKNIRYIKKKNFLNLRKKTEIQIH